MPQLTQQRGVLVVAVCVVLYAISTRIPMHATAGSSTVTREYDAAGCGRVREIGREIGGPSGKAMTLCLLNFERARHGLPPLVENVLLDRASEQHSADMVQRRFFEHVNPDGVTPASRITAAGYRPPGGSTGENIAWGSGGVASPASIVDGWMHSPGHRANILRPIFREVGIGVSVGRPPAGDKNQLRAATYTTDFGG